MDEKQESYTFKLNINEIQPQTCKFITNSPIIFEWNPPLLLLGPVLKPLHSVQHLLSYYYFVSGTVLGTGDEKMGKTHNFFQVAQSRWVYLHGYKRDLACKFSQ